MSAFGRWFSGRRSEQHAPAAPEPPATTTPDQGPGTDAASTPAGVDWGSSGDVELGPPPPPDADVNHGPPTGPLPVFGSSPWGAPRTGGTAPAGSSSDGPTSDGPSSAGPTSAGPSGGVPAWARSERSGDGSAEPPWRRPSPPDPGPTELPASRPDRAAAPSKGPDVVPGRPEVEPHTTGTPDEGRASVDAFTAWFATSGSAGATSGAVAAGDRSPAAAPPDSWPPAAAPADRPVTLADEAGADGAGRDGSAPGERSSQSGTGTTSTGTTAAGPTSLSEEIADAGTDADPADPQSRAGAAAAAAGHSGGTADDRPTAATSASSSPERGTGADMSSPDGTDEPTPPTGLPVPGALAARAVPAAGTPAAQTPGTEVPTTEAQAGEPRDAEVPAAEVPAAEVPAAVAADDRENAAAGPPTADELDAPVHADVHSPIALDPDLMSTAAPDHTSAGERGPDSSAPAGADTAATTSALTASSFAPRPEPTAPDDDPSTDRPSTDRPSTDRPSTDRPSSDGPSTELFATEPDPALTESIAAVPGGPPPAAASPAPAAPASPAPGPTRPETTAPAARAAGLHTVGAASAPDVAVDREHLAQGRLGVDAVTPEVSGGRFPSKAVVGEVVPVTASVWREGHDAVGASVVWSRCSDAAHAAATADLRGAVCGASGGETREVRMVSAGPETDRFVGTIVPDVEGLWSFRVDAWSDPWATWRHAVEVKEAAGQGPAELANDLESGARLLDRAAAAIRERFRTGAGTPSAPSTNTNTGTGTGDFSTGVTVPITMPPALAIAQTLGLAAQALRDDSAGLADRLGPALAPAVDRTMIEQPVRELVTRGATHHVVVERARALDGAWYEFFPRSTGGTDAAGHAVHGTFATATRELERVAAMGFDVAYLPPIHPVGTVNRKGPNNTLTPGPDDVGSPWAIGSADGGHDAIEPALGTVEDFDAFVARAHELGLEVALDFALQCAPDHPWAAEHPEWFTVRPDGTIAYAENPPKKYQDIYPVNFDVDPEGIYRESLRVLLGWLEHGVRIFRVDNPHTKPPDFWAWVIDEVHRVDPGVVFLAEAFTRPARLFGLAKLGFSQSYTYFTWRTGKEEIQEFFELHRDRVDECRPNCFVNTPDILHESLQTGGPGMFALRAALAATLSPSWGVYAGFELFEDRAVRPGSEEYLDSEKYQLRPRDFAGALAAGRNLEPWITRLNEIRRAHPALRQIRTLRFHEIDNPALLAFSKTDPRSGDTVVGVITLNPYGAEEGTLHLDLSALGLGPSDRFAAVDEVSGETFDWGPANFVRLEPWRAVAHVIAVRRR